MIIITFRFAIVPVSYCVTASSVLGIYADIVLIQFISAALVNDNDAYAAVALARFAVDNKI